MRIIRDILANRPPTFIYHYTDAAGIIGIVERKQLWATKICHLNDSAEYAHARGWLIKELKRRDEFSLANVLNAPNALLTGIDLGRRVLHNTETDAPLYVLSFSSQRNLLSQWRGYCPKGDGFSLGFDASEFPSNPLSGVQMVKCAYGALEREILCESLINSWHECDPKSQDAVTTLYNDSLTVMALLKERSFAEEDEWRMILISPAAVNFRTGRHGIVPYAAVDIATNGWPTLKEVWVGPNSDDEAASSAVRMLLDKNGFSDTQICISETPLRI